MTLLLAGMLSALAEPSTHSGARHWLSPCREGATRTPPVVASSQQAVLPSAGVVAGAPLVHPGPGHSGARDCQTHWFEQRLDHFSWDLPPAAQVTESVLHCLPRTAIPIDLCICKPSRLLCELHAARVTSGRICSALLRRR